MFRTHLAGRFMTSLAPKTVERNGGVSKFVINKAIAVCYLIFVNDIKQRIFLFFKGESSGSSAASKLVIQFKVLIRLNK